jgi:threonine synthase
MKGDGPALAMTTPQLRFYSTNGGVPPATFADALLKGQAADRGLFMPDRYPTLPPETLQAFVGKSYPEIAHAVLAPFTAGALTDGLQRELCNDAYNYDVPLEKVTGKRYLMRLDRGPTASFKDFAARMMARWMSGLTADDKEDLVILTATSGDTGSAVAHAYFGVKHVHVVVLFPIDEVSARQRKQMTTLGGNITTLAIRGKFDDCQAMVKRAFSDPELTKIRLSSANSINIGRLLPQSVYYIYAYVRLANVEAREPIIFSIPSGNFGDMMGAIMARKMGLPIERLVIATNANDEVPRFLATGRYQKIEPSRECISNAMNVGHPSNLARLVDAYGGWMTETGELKREPDMAALRRDLYSVSIADEDTRATIKRAYQDHGVILEPHGAVAWAGLARFFNDHPKSKDLLTVSVETAHPAKFPDEIKSLIGIDPPVPPSLRGIEDRTEKYDTITTDYHPFKTFLRQTFVA